MDDKDLKQIGELVDKSFERALKPTFEEGFEKAFTNVWENNIGPAFDQINEKIYILTTKLDKALYHEFDRLEKRLEVVETKLGIRS